MNLNTSKLNRWALTEDVEWYLTVASFGHLPVIKRNKGIYHFGSTHLFQLLYYLYI